MFSSKKIIIPFVEIHTLVLEIILLSSTVACRTSSSRRVLFLPYIMRIIYYNTKGSLLNPFPVVMGANENYVTHIF